MTKTIEIGAPIATRPRRRWPLAVGIVALIGIGGSSWAAAHADSGTPAERADLRDPAVRDAHVQMQIAEWARENHLAGLSPASLRPMPERTDTPSRFGPR